MSNMQNENEGAELKELLNKCRQVRETLREVAFRARDVNLMLNEDVCFLLSSLDGIINRAERFLK